MKLYISLCALLTIDSVFAGCGAKNENVPQLMLKTKDEYNANTDDKVVLSIFSGGQWSDWVNVDNLGCNDRERGQTDYFDVPSITASWDAVALYNCGTDGVIIEEIGYWNGQNNDDTITYFCDNIGGLPFREDEYCFTGRTPADPSFGKCYKGVDNGVIYKEFWLDQDNGKCKGVSIATGKNLVKDKSTPIAKLYYKSDPGTPSCSALLGVDNENKLFAIDNFTSSEQGTLSNGWKAVIALFIVISILGLFGSWKYYYQNKKYLDYVKVNNDVETAYGSVNA